MNNLKKKISIVLITLLSIFICFIFIFYNVSIYNREENNIKQKIMRINSDHEKYNDYFEDKNLIFIDDEIYIVRFNILGEIEQIRSYYIDGLTEDKITHLINKNIKKINNRKINNLYTSNYIFNLNKNNLVIMNNKSTKNYLIQSLIWSFILLSILEAIAIYLSFMITKWIVKPVEEMFIKQKQFISDASHELKTPLAIISASIETIEGKPKDQKWMNNIKEETNRMNYLVSNLLVLSKTEDIKEKEVYLDEDLSKLVQKKALSFESLMFESNLSLETNIEDNIIFNCNGDRIKELLSIILDNAIKHGEKNSTIKVELKKEKNNINLLVINKGKEIPVSEREKIFERFYRVDKSRNRDSNRYGLGLSIALNIALNHNGVIKVDCNNGYTTFKVIFKQN